jgi:hypothetical protein
VDVVVERVDQQRPCVRCSRVHVDEILVDFCVEQRELDGRVLEEGD